jgi:ribulose-5-phosphate 4-epimerase/fuculose-1-phosphate aldolase
MNNQLYLFSPRNTDKRRLTAQDFVAISPPWYYGDRKYSVDAPVQIETYKRFPEIHYMIHGHAFIENGQCTSNYYPCGDLREIDEIVKLLDLDFNFFNLKQHGFLLCASSLEEMEKYVTELKFKVSDKLI